MTPIQARMIMDSIEAAGVKYLDLIADNQRKDSLGSDINSIIEHAKSNGLISRFENPRFLVISHSYQDLLQVVPSNYDAVRIFYLSGQAVNGDGDGSPVEGYLTPDGYFFKSLPSHPWHEDDETDYSGRSVPQSTYEAEGFKFDKPDAREEWRGEFEDSVRDIDGNRTESYATEIIPQVLLEKADKVYVEYSWEKEQQAKTSLEKSMSSGNAPIKDDDDLPPVRGRSKLTRQDKIRKANLKHEAAVLEAAGVIQASYDADVKAQDLIKYVSECWDDYVEELSAARDDK